MSLQAPCKWITARRHDEPRSTDRIQLTSLKPQFCHKTNPGSGTLCSTGQAPPSATKQKMVTTEHGTEAAHVWHPSKSCACRKGGHFGCFWVLFWKSILLYFILPVNIWPVWVSIVSCPKASWISKRRPTEGGHSFSWIGFWSPEPRWMLLLTLFQRRMMSILVT